MFDVSMTPYRCKWHLESIYETLDLGIHTGPSDAKRVSCIEGRSPKKSIDITS